MKEQTPLGEKHQQTIKNIKDLQDVEKYMFNNLQSLNKSSPDSILESQMIQTRLDELSSTRMNLFSELKNMYTDKQKQTAGSRSNLADQLTINKVISNEKNNAIKELVSLEQERENKKRLVELGTYEYDRYRSHKNILKVITYGSLCVLLIVILMGQNWFPSSIGVLSICLIIVVVIITIGGRMIDNFNRNNREWDKFEYADISGSNSRDTKSLDWNKLGNMFSGTCVYIADKYNENKDKLLNNKDQAKINMDIANNNANSDIAVTNDGFVGQMGGFSVVNPSQPKGHEHFHNIF